ncbi:MAG: aconitase/3-isopropylmalate dehydratase large subunit family protein [Anaerolineae bacterium]
MGMTITEKILARAAGQETVRPGDIVVVGVETAVVLDISFFLDQTRWPVRLFDPDKVVVIHDHLSPPKNIRTAEAVLKGRRFVQEHGITRFHDVGARQGIVHQLVADEAYALPGTVLLCEDSHTCSAGALNCCARGIGSPELTYVLCKGETWFAVGPTIRYDLVGSLPHLVSAKDAFLFIADHYGSHEQTNMEFGGPAMPQLSLNARRTLSTMAAEVSAEFAIWEPDDILMEHVRSRTARPCFPTYPDPDADYLDVRTLDLDQLEPYVALPDTVVHNTVPVSELDEQVKVDQCFVGSCSNGTLDDLATAASIVAGKQVAPGVRFIVTPGSQAICREAARQGIIDILIEAGALITPSACGVCGGIDYGVLAGEEVCLTSSTRNFKGRMGSSEAKIYISSSATVAATAITGYITDPRAL